MSEIEYFFAVAQQRQMQRFIFVTKWNAIRGKHKNRCYDCDKRMI